MAAKTKLKGQFYINNKQPCTNWFKMFYGSKENKYIDSSVVFSYDLTSLLTGWWTSVFDEFYQYLCVGSKCSKVQSWVCCWLPLKSIIRAKKYDEKNTWVGTLKKNLYSGPCTYITWARSTWFQVKFLFQDDSRVHVLFMFHENLLKILIICIK